MNIKYSTYDEILEEGLYDVGGWNLDNLHDLCIDATEFVLNEWYNVFIKKGKKLEFRNVLINYLEENVILYRLYNYIHNHYIKSPKGHSCVKEIAFKILDMSDLKVLQDVFDLNISKQEYDTLKKQKPSKVFVCRKIKAVVRFEAELNDVTFNKKSLFFSTKYCYFCVYGKFREDENFYNKVAKSTTTSKQLVQKIYKYIKQQLNNVEPIYYGVVLEKVEKFFTTKSNNTIFNEVFK